MRKTALCLVALALIWLAAPAGAQWPDMYRHFLPAPPRHMTLCEEKVPLHLPFVNEQLDREFNIAVHDQAQVVLWMKRAQRYFPYISRRLRKAGLPDDLKYLAVAESALLVQIRSFAGAVGPWQFMEATGRRYGLRRNRYFDDRMHLEKSTNAAIRYLKELRKKFGSWTLAMAAYNAGERRISRAIKQQGVKNYYHLWLPNETQRYIYRILSAKIILGDPRRYGYFIPDVRLYRPVASEKAKIHLRRSLHLKRLAEASATTVRRLKDLNPHIRGYYLPRGTHEIKVPPGQSKGLMARLKKSRPAPEPEVAEWIVRTGDNLGLIARSTGVSIRALKRANGIRGWVIYPGQRLMIPGR